MEECKPCRLKHWCELANKMIEEEQYPWEEEQYQCRFETLEEANKYAEWYYG